MAIRQLDNPVFKSVLKNGSPNSLGTIGVYKDGTSFATLATIWDSQAKTVELSNPITLTSSGEKEIWFDDVVDIEIKDKDGNLLDQVLSVSSSPSAIATGNFNLIQNGSFEIDTDSDGAPNDWSLSLDSGGTIAIDSTSGGQTHGTNGLKFTGSGSGAGSATSVKFDVLAGGMLNTEFSYKSSAATTTNSVKINWYKFDDSASATASTVVHSLATGNPSSWTSYIYKSAIPTDAVKAEIVITGVLSSGTNKTGPTYFDDIKAYPSSALIEKSVPSQVNSVKITGSATTVNPRIASDGEANSGLILADSNGNEVVILESVASAVNEITITNAATGNKPSIDNTGEDVGIDIEGVELKNAVTTSNTTNTNTLTAKTTNADMNLNNNGTGKVKVNGVPIGFRGALVSVLSSQSIPNTTSTAIVFTTESYDTDSIHDNATNNTRMTIPSGVTKVRASFSIEYAASATGQRKITMLSDGALNIAGGIDVSEDVNSSGSHVISYSSSVFDVSSIGYIEIYAYQDSGGALNVLAGSFRSWLALEVIE